MQLHRGSGALQHIPKAWRHQTDKAVPGTEWGLEKHGDLKNTVWPGNSACFLRPRMFGCEQLRKTGWGHIVTHGTQCSYWEISQNTRFQASYSMPWGNLVDRPHGKELGPARSQWGSLKAGFPRPAKSHWSELGSRSCPCDTTNRLTATLLETLNPNQPVRSLPKFFSVGRLRGSVFVFRLLC